ncbi:hypothetical protein DESC_780402 [Desulfosarcina cetonica]|nr:hypothetical protein DESC_780402 [Desulfosarcina cetonica]
MRIFTEIPFPIVPCAAPIRRIEIDLFEFKGYILYCSITSFIYNEYMYGMALARRNIRFFQIYLNLFNRLTLGCGLRMKICRALAIDGAPHQGCEDYEQILFISGHKKMHRLPFL